MNRKSVLWTDKGILSNPNHEQFERDIQYLVLSLEFKVVESFCNILAQYVGRDQSNQSFVHFLFAAVVALSQRGPEFRENVFVSMFLTKLHISNREQTDFLLEFLFPIFTIERRWLIPSIFQSIASLFLFYPREALNLMSIFVKNTNEFDLRFLTAMSLFLGLWPMFIPDLLHSAVDFHVKCLGLSRKVFR
jgi:hypothetical protein